MRHSHLHWLQLTILHLLEMHSDYPGTLFNKTLFFPRIEKSQEIHQVLLPARSASAKVEFGQVKICLTWEFLMHNDLFDAKWISVSIFNTGKLQMWRRCPHFDIGEGGIRILTLKAFHTAAIKRLAIIACTWTGAVEKLSVYWKHSLCINLAAGAPFLITGVAQMVTLLSFVSVDAPHIPYFKIHHRYWGSDYFLSRPCSGQ